jgi:hypothetical protein
METTEGNVRVVDRPEITIGDKPLAECSINVIASTMLRLLKNIGEQREQIRELTKQLEST